MSFMEGDEAFSSENLSDEQILEIGMKYFMKAVPIYVCVILKTTENLR